MESENRPCVCTVQDRQGRPLLVLVLHVQKYKPLHCSQHAGGVSGQKAETTVETGLISIPPVLPSSYPPPPLLLQNRSVALDVVFPVY